MKTKKSFTLIELLVVIAIIAIMAAMLLPALGSTKKTAQRSNCLGNLKTLGTGMILYANSNNSTLPMTKFKTGGTNTGLICALINELKLARTAVYYKKTSLICPAFSNDKIYSDASLRQWDFEDNELSSIFYSYGGNATVFPTPISAFLKVSVKLDKIRKPGNVFGMADAKGAPIIEYSIQRFYNIHGKSFNVMWMDGHTSNYKNNYSENTNLSSITGIGPGPGGRAIAVGYPSKTRHLGLKPFWGDED